MAVTVNLTLAKWSVVRYCSLSCTSWGSKPFLREVSGLLNVVTLTLLSLSVLFVCDLVIIFLFGVSLRPLDNKVPAACLRSMAMELTTKLDTVLSNQEGILSRIAAVKNKQLVMEESLQFASKSIEEIQSENKILSDGCSGLTALISTSEVKIKQLEEATLQLDRHSRSFNLRFGGVPETSSDPSTLPYEAVKRILAEKFQMPGTEVEAAHRTGRATKSPTDKPRHIIARFIFRHERYSVLVNAKKALTNSDVFVLPDLPAADVSKKRALRDVMKRAYDAGHHPVFRINGELFI